MAQLSRAHGYTEAAVGIALDRPWPTLEKIIADFLGVQPRELWPRRYTRNGEPLPGARASFERQRRTA